MSFEWSSGDDSGYLPNDPLTRKGVTHIDGFRLERQIGEGGMGVVYRAWDEAVGRPVAIKLLLAGARANPAQRKRFQRELQALGKLRHPALLTVHRSGDVQGIPYMATEWLDGTPLDERVRSGPLPPAEAASIMVEVARAVEHAHDHGILHRDIKPANIVVEPQRGPVLLDFGLAKSNDLAASRITRSGTFAGTMAYAPPEQLVDAGKVDERADIYSLGATLFCLLTGESPAERIDNLLALATAAAEGRLPTPRDIAPDCPRELDAIVRRAMRPAPEERYPTADDFARALERALRPPARRTARIGKVVAGAAITAGLGVALALARAGRDPDPASTTATSSTPGSDPTTEAAGPTTEAAGPTASAPADAADRRLARIHADLDALMVTVTERGPADGRAWRGYLQRLRKGLSGAIVEVRPLGGMAGKARLGAALADAGRYAEALEALRAGRDAGDLRSLLTWSSARAARAAAQGEPLQVVLPTVQRITAARPAGAADERVIQLAAVWVEHLRDPAPDKAALRRRLSAAAELVARDGSTPAWFSREVWLAVAAFMGRAPTPQARIDLGHTLVQLDKRATAPWWSQAYLELWLRGWGPIRVLSPMLNRMELLVTHLPTRARVEILARLASLSGRLGTIERLHDLFPKARLRRMKQVAEQVAAQESGVPRGAKFINRGRTLSVTLPPTESKMRIVWVFPEGPWTLRLRGAEADVDLYVRHDGPPRASDPLTLKGQTMARDEQVSSDPARPTSGVHQIVLERSNPWPEPLEVDLELVSPAPAWTAPWAFTGPTTYPEGTLPRLREARRLNQAGDLNGAIATLREAEREVPSLILVRASMLSNAGAWGGVREIQAGTKMTDPGIRRALAYEAGRVALLGGEPEVAEALLLGLLERDPAVLAAAEELALAQVGRGRWLSAQATLNRILKRDPSQVHAELLRRALAAISERGDPAPRIAALKRLLRARARSRELVVRGLLLAKRAQLALPLLEGEERPRYLVWRLEALIALKRTADAKALLSRLLAIPLAPFRKLELKRLASKL